MPKPPVRWSKLSRRAKSGRKPWRNSRRCSRLLLLATKNSWAPFQRPPAKSCRRRGNTSRSRGNASSRSVRKTDNLCAHSADRLAEECNSSLTCGRRLSRTSCNPTQRCKTNKSKPTMKAFMETKQKNPTLPMMTGTSE